MDRWKAAGRAGRAADEHLWQEFRSAQDKFYEARSASLAERDADLSNNLAAKEALATEAERILPVGDLGRRRPPCATVQERWEKIGHVPRADRDRVEARLKRVEQSVRRRTKPAGGAATPRLAPGRRPPSTSSRPPSPSCRSRRTGPKRPATPRASATANESIEARRSWLVEAERALTEFGGR